MSNKVGAASQRCSIAVRQMLPKDARLFLEIHHAAVRDLASKDYQPTVIEVWAPLPITDKAVESFLANPDNEIRLVAEVAGEVVGIGAIVAGKAELRACYVLPEMARKGIGLSLVREIERIAQDLHLTHLELDASVNSEAFYAALGYEVVDRTEHVLSPSGQHMPCVKMQKLFL
jgi:putative acetyltransferase